MSPSNLLNLLAVASILFISCESQTDQPNASTSSKYDVVFNFSFKDRVETALRVTIASS